MTRTLNKKRFLIGKYRRIASKKRRNVSRKKMYGGVFVLKPVYNFTAYILTPDVHVQNKSLCIDEDRTSITRKLQITATKNSNAPMDLVTTVATFPILRTYYTFDIILSGQPTDRDFTDRVKRAKRANLNIDELRELITKYLTLAYYKEEEFPIFVNYIDNDDDNSIAWIDQIEFDGNTTCHNTGKWFSGRVVKPDACEIDALNAGCHT